MFVFRSISMFVSLALFMSLFVLTRDSGGRDYRVAARRCLTRVTRGMECLQIGNDLLSERQSSDSDENKSGELGGSETNGTKDSLRE